jgi:hypothetical protein
MSPALLLQKQQIYGLMDQSFGYKPFPLHQAPTQKYRKQRLGEVSKGNGILVTK